MNENKRNVLIGFGVILIAVILLFSYFGRSNTVVEKIIERIVEKKEFGAFPGPNITTDCIEWNGTDVCVYRSVMQTGTTTVCNFGLPSASSTLVRAAAVSNSSISTTTGSFTITARESNYATSSSGTNNPVAGVTVTQNTKLNINGTSSATSTWIFPPSGRLTYELSGPAAGSHFVGSGFCNAMIQTIR